MLGAALGFPVTLCMPSNVSPERKEILAAYGAEIVWTDPADGSDGAIRKARELAAAEPDRYFYADQYSNDENWRAHYRTTGQRNLGADRRPGHPLRRRPGHQRHLHGDHAPAAELNPNIQCISMQPDSPFNGLEGLKHMATAIVPPIYDPDLADETSRWRPSAPTPWPSDLGRKHGLLVGVSAAAAVAAVARRSPKQRRAAGREAVIVTILCDSRRQVHERTLLAEGVTNASNSTSLRLRGPPRARRRDLSARVLRRLCSGKADAEATTSARSSAPATPAPTPRTTATTSRRRNW